MIYTLASKQSLFRYPLAFNLVGFGRTAQLYIIASWFRGSGRQGAGLRVSELRVSFTGFGLYKDLAFSAQEYRDPTTWQLSVRWWKFMPRIATAKAVPDLRGRGPV